MLLLIILLLLFCLDDADLGFPRYYTITFVNDKCLSKSDVWYIFSKVSDKFKVMVEIDPFNFAVWDCSLC